MNKLTDTEHKKGSTTFCETFSEHEIPRTRDAPDLARKVLTKKAPQFLVRLFYERETGLEPATPTLARSCSTN